MKSTWEYGYLMYTALQALLHATMDAAIPLGPKILQAG